MLQRFSLFVCLFVCLFFVLSFCFVLFCFVFYEKWRVRIKPKRVLCDYKVTEIVLTMEAELKIIFAFNMIVGLKNSESLNSLPAIHAMVRPTDSG